MLKRVLCLAALLALPSAISAASITIDYPETNEVIKGQTFEAFGKADMGKTGNGVFVELRNANNVVVDSGLAEYDPCTGEWYVTITGQVGNNYKFIAYVIDTAASATHLGITIQACDPTSAVVLFNSPRCGDRVCVRRFRLAA